MYLYLKSSKTHCEYIPEKMSEVIDLDWTMSMEDYMWFLCAGIVTGAWGVLIYLSL